MKITKERLDQIIREETSAVLSEGEVGNIITDEHVQWLKSNYKAVFDAIKAGEDVAGAGHGKAYVQPIQHGSAHPESAYQQFIKAFPEVAKAFKKENKLYMLAVEIANAVREQDLIKNLNSILQSYWQPGNEIGDASEFAQQFKLAKNKLSSEFQAAYDLQAQKYIDHMNWKRKKEEEYEAEFPGSGGL